VEVAGLADAVSVVLVPGMGDAVQSLKAGVLEIASVFVLNKADRDGPDGIARLEAEIEEMVGLSAVISGRMGGPRIVKTVATTGVGVVELLGVVEGLAAGGRAGVKTPSGFSPRLPGLKPRPTAEATVLPAGAVLDHLGIAVRSIADSRRLYEALGVRPGEVEEIPQERVRALMLTLGESRIELLEAAESDSVIARFVAKRGEGLHHVALRVADLARTVERLKALGVRLVSETIQVGAGGHKYVFVHPASANGVLLELVEADGGHAE
jgi:LAO/AO transport system kinase